ncbi:MAG TPA: cytochrome c oxidase assembly protein [Sphingomonas sp.]|nr:cytochrome c oxidase assembly protein [Sphingomonas sp.]
MRALSWTFDPWILVPMLVAAALFAAGWIRLASRGGAGTVALRGRALSFALGLVTLFGALVSPLHEAGEHSFALHMIEHELLMLVVPPLLVLAEPLAIMRWAFPPDAHRAFRGFFASRPIAATRRWLTACIPATLLQTATLWLWHAPPLFDLALASRGWHVVQHLCFLGTALWFWTAMFRRSEGDVDAYRRCALAILCLFATSIASGALGALLAFSESPWYAPYARPGLDLLGLSPAQDQQLAGLIMWIPGGLVHTVAALLIVHRMVTGWKLADVR